MDDWRWVIALFSSLLSFSGANLYLGRQISLKGVVTCGEFVLMYLVMASSIAVMAAFFNLVRRGTCPIIGFIYMPVVAIIYIYFCLARLEKIEAHKVSSPQRPKS